MNEDSNQELEYVGFWPRVGASIIDTILLGVIIWPLLTAFYGEKYWTTNDFIRGPMDFLLSWIFPLVAVIIFWVTKSATPGKMAIGAKIVDERTGGKPSVGQLIGRYFAYYLSITPFFYRMYMDCLGRKKAGMA